VHRLDAMSRWIGTVHKGTALPLVQSALFSIRSARYGKYIIFLLQGKEHFIAA